MKTESQTTSYLNSMRALWLYLSIAFSIVLILPSASRGDSPSMKSKQTSADADKETTFRLGVYTSDKPSEMYRKFRPVTDYLQNYIRLLGLPYNIDLKVYPSYIAAIDALTSGECDIARFGPASYILAKERNSGIQILAIEHKQGKKSFDGVFVVPKSSPIESIQQLRGTKFAFGNENSTIGRYLSQSQLVKAGIYSRDLEEFNYLDRHDQVALAVANGNYDAGVIKESTYKKYSDKLKIIDRFPNVTKPWIVRANFDNTLFTTLQNALLELKDKELLDVIGKDGFLSGEDKDYEVVREGMKISSQFASE